jgi:hypothetical protein
VRHLSNADTLARVDALIERGVLRSTGGAFPSSRSGAIASRLDSPAAESASM